MMGQGKGMDDGMDMEGDMWLVTSIMNFIDRKSVV